MCYLLWQAALESTCDTYHQNDWRQNPLSGVKRVVWPYLVMSAAAIAKILQETARNLLRVHWQAADVGLFDSAASGDKKQTSCNGTQSCRSFGRYQLHRAHTNETSEQKPESPCDRRSHDSLTVLFDSHTHVPTAFYGNLSTLSIVWLQLELAPSCSSGLRSQHCLRHLVRDLVASWHVHELNIAEPSARQRNVH